MGDLDFIQRCVRADKLAWKEFLEKYSRLIYSYIYSVIRIKGYFFDSSVAEEIFNEIISSLIKDDFRKLKTYQGRNNASLASWLRQVSINFSLGYLRKKEGPVMLSLNAANGEGLVLSEIIPLRSLSAADELMRREKDEDLAECIQKLDLDDKFFLELKLRWELSLEDLKHFLRISRAATDMRYTRIISRLRECFKEKGFLAP